MNQLSFQASFIAIRRIKSLLHRLQSLTLRNTAVDDTCLQHVSQLKSLQVLDLTGTSVTKEAVARLQKEMPALTVIDPQNQVIAATNASKR